MSEFRNRMDCQREVLRVVNRSTNQKEELCGLSEAAIIRWLQANGVSNESRVATLLRRISEKLFFLATKSQEQVTEDYKSLSREVTRFIKDLASEI